jgi:hypothetical protein
VPIKVHIKEGDTYTLPANMPDSYEVACEAELVDRSMAPRPAHGTIVTSLSVLLETDPSDVDLEPGSSVIIVARRSEYEYLNVLNRFVDGAYLSQQNISIDIWPDPRGE